jgi:predicted Zn-dependent protease
MNLSRYFGWVGLLLVGSGLVVVTVTGCVTNEAGRKQLMLVSQQEEMQLGLNAFDQMKTNTPISKDPVANDMVKRVGDRIKTVVNLNGAQWEFVVFESKEANAFCLPGGKIGVYTGILPLVKDDAGLAVVLGHEIAHATLHHGAERMSRGIAMQVVGQGLGYAVDTANPKWTAAFAQLYGIGSGVAVELPHSRSSESEADKIGLFYMAKAGYDPEAAISFWERFAEYGKQAGGKPPKWLSTHPDEGTRIQNLKALMPEAKALYKPR